MLTSGSSQGVRGFPLRLCHTKLQGNPFRCSETLRQAVSICATYGQRSARAIGMLCAVKRSSGLVSPEFRYLLLAARLTSSA